MQMYEEGETVRLVRMISGITILTASAWMGPALANLLGVSEVFGYVSVSSLLAFLGGCIFWSGFTDDDRRCDHDHL